MIDILCFTPNLHMLSFESMPLYKNDHLADVEQWENFRRVSETNQIRHVTFRDKCTLEKVKLLVALCPRVQYLSISTLVRTLEPIIRFLLDKNNTNTRQLCLLCFSRACVVWFKRLDLLIKLESLLDDYTLKCTGSQLHLWW